MTNATRPEDEKLPPHLLVAYGLQHILTMYAGVIAPPLIIGAAAGLPAAKLGELVSAALLLSGAATMLQTLGIWRVGSRLPLIQGISFASVSTMIAIAGHDGLTAVYGAVIAAGVFGFLVAPWFSQLVRFFPPVVTGSVITIIGVSLLPVAFSWALGGDAKAPGYASPRNIALAGATLLIILLITRLLPGLLSRLSVLLGLVLGAGVAAAAGMTNFSAVGSGPMVALPTPFAFGTPTFNVAAIVSMVIVILVVMTETTADILAVGEIIGTPVDSRRVADGLRADMASTAIAPLVNTFPCSAFAQNVGLVALTGIKSRFAVATGGLVLFVLGLLPVLGRVIAAVPQPVLGGAGIVLFGTVAASGIRTLSRVDYDNGLNLVIVATAVGVGLIPITMPDFYAHFPHGCRPS